MKFFFVNFFVILLTLDSLFGATVDPEKCKISLKTYKGMPQPLLFDGALTKILYPETNFIELKKNDIVHLGCPGDDNHLRGGDVSKHTTQIKCKGSNKFTKLPSSDERVFEEFLCQRIPESTYKQLSDPSCPDPNIYFQVGFQADNKYFNLYNVCYDPNKETPLFTKFHMGSYVKHDGVYFFTQNDSFKKFKVITKTSVKEIDPNLMYNNQQSVIRIPNDKLQRGHITADKDFLYEAEHIATRYYFNTAPQWQSLNIGHWKKVENSIRSYAQNYLKQIEVFAGVQTSTSNIFLNSQGKLPVPTFFWKTIIDKTDGVAKGLAFIAVNNPQLTSLLKQQLKSINRCSQYNEFVKEMNDAITCCSFADMYALFGLTTGTGLPVLVSTPVLDSKVTADSGPSSKRKKTKK